MCMHPMLSLLLTYLVVWLYSVMFGCLFSVVLTVSFQELDCAWSNLWSKQLGAGVLLGHLISVLYKRNYSKGQ